MKHTVYGQEEHVLPWIAERTDTNSFGPGATAIGLESEGKLIAGVAFNMYTGPSICLNVASEPGKNWLTRDFLFRAFAYPFIQLKCNRVTVLVRVDNSRSRKFVEHLGFIQEGLLRRAAVDGTDMIVYGMLQNECRFLRITS